MQERTQTSHNSILKRYVDFFSYYHQANVAYLDKKLVAFGTVVEGMDVVYRIELCGTSKGSTKWYFYNLQILSICSKVIIEDCGEIKKNPSVDLDQIKSYVPLSLRE